MTVETVDDEIETTITDDEPAAGAEDRGDSFTPTADDEPAAPVVTPAEEETAKPNSGMIPKARFDEVNNAKKAAEQQAATLLAEIEALRRGEVKPEAPAAVSPELADLERQRIDAMMDGDVDKAVELAAQINSVVRAQARAEALQEIEDRTSQQTTAQRVDESVAAVIAAYPAFDDNSEQANPEAIAELVEFRDFYIAKKGMHPAEAISKAAEKVAQMFDLDAPAADKGVDPRTKAAIERGAHIAATQPSTSAVGVGTRQDVGKVNIQAMTEEQFDALPEAEKRRMRGD